MKGLKEREAVTTSDVKSDTKLPSEDEVCVFQYLFSKNRVELAEKIEQYERVKGQCAKLQQQVDELEQNPPPQVFINSLERYVCTLVQFSIFDFSGIIAFIF